MYMQPDLERMKRLRVDGYPDKSQIVFCPDCAFQMPPLTIGPTYCPECGHHMHLTTMCDELAEIVKSAR